MLRTIGDDAGRGQVLSTSTIDCRLLVTLGIHSSSVYSQLGVRQRCMAHWDQLMYLVT